MSQSYYSMWTYPWDLRDEGFGPVIQNLKENIGLDGMRLASAYHTFDMLRPHLATRNTLQLPEAAVYFQPQMGLYSGTCIKPHVSPLMGSENWYAEAANAASGVDLDLIAWTVFLHNSYLAQHYPQCAIVRCTGDVSPSGLCPAHPDVRAYACALSVDLVRNCGVKVLECESLSYQGWGHSHYHVKHGVSLGAGGQYLFSLCFCDACQKQASECGIDVGRLRERVDEKMRHIFASGHPLESSPDELADEIPDLSAFNRVREDIVTSLIREVREAVQIPICFIFMGNRDVSGADPAAVCQVADGVEILSYTNDPQRTHRAVSDRLPVLRASEQLVVGLQAYPPASPDAETLGQNLTAASELGVRSFSFYNYGIMPLPCLAWVKQVINRS